VTGWYRCEAATGVVDNPHGLKTYLFHSTTFAAAQTLYFVQLNEMCAEVVGKTDKSEWRARGGAGCRRGIEVGIPPPPDRAHGHPVGHGQNLIITPPPQPPFTILPSFLPSSLHPADETVYTFCRLFLELGLSRRFLLRCFLRARPRSKDPLAPSDPVACSVTSSNNRHTTSSPLAFAVP
jgi:hypothetical protein